MANSLNNAKPSAVAAWSGDIAPVFRGAGWGRWMGWGLGLCLMSRLGLAGADGAAETAPDPVVGVAPTATDASGSARETVRGLGWLGNLRMRATLRQARGSNAGDEALLDADTVEDGAFLLLNDAQNLGYLAAAVTAEMILSTGEPWTMTWRDRDLEPLPRPLAAREVHYRVTLGRRYRYASVEFSGLTVMGAGTAGSYFVRADGLLSTPALRRFSRGEFARGMGALEDSLRDLGYVGAQVRSGRMDMDPETGEVRVVVDVEEGPRHVVTGVRVVVLGVAGEPPVSETSRPWEGRPLSRELLENLEQALLVSGFQDGYPDTVVRIVTGPPQPGGPGEVGVEVRAEVVRGSRVRLGSVRIEGAPTGRAALAMQRRARLDGPWLDRTEVDEARARIARLGGIRFIRVEYEPSVDDPGARDAVFRVEPGRRLSLDLLAGFRSYELFYAGVELTRRNLFDAGHSVDLRAVQSFKSTEGSATYSIPDVWVEDLTVFGQAQFLRRQEISFRREEYRAGAGLRRSFGDTGHEVGVRYTHELLRALDAPVELPRSAIANDRQRVASVTVDWSLDRRDSGIGARRGFDVGVSLEAAVPELGGEARYLRPEVRASGHLPVGGGRFLHAGVRGSWVVDPVDADSVPFNKRFFPGGDDSVRGYLRGEAAPLNAMGELIGAEAALVWNLEFEQLLTPSWSAVAFVDGVAQSADVREAVVAETLWSVGLGVRWNTAIGPVRLEYGHNLNRRDPDPSGTVQLSIGMPF